MATMYTALVYPQVPQGGAYTRPTLPSTVTGSTPALTSPNWDPYSSDPNNRTEWWADSQGTLTWDQVRLDAYGLSGVKQNAITRLRNACDAEISKGYNSTALGTTHTYPSSKSTDQINMISSAQVAKLSGKPWTANTVVSKGNVVQTSAGTWLVCSTAGTTGSTEPTGAGTDGSVTWKDLFPFMCADSNGVWAMRTHNPSQIVQAGMDGYGSISASRIKLAELEQQVHAITDSSVTGVQKIDAIVW